TLTAATKAERRQQAVQLVKQALHNEVYGGLAERARLLQSAQQVDAQYAPAQWHQGCVQFKRTWIDAEKLPALLKEDPRITLYLKQREQAGDTISGNLLMADWRRKKGLQEQERAHLLRVLDFDANQQVARTRLGFRQINGQWVTPADLQQARQRFVVDQQNFTTWGPRIEKLRRQLHKRSPAQRAAARQQVLQITDSAAIFALEQVLARDTEPTVAFLALEALHQLPDYEATQALARIAVTTPLEAVRKQSAKYLKSRNPDDYVPALLACMYTPVTSRMMVTPTRNGQLMYRHMFFREGQDQNQLLVLDTNFRRQSAPGGNQNETLNRTLSGALVAAINREREVLRQNFQTQALNTRICNTLNSSLEQELAPQPAIWWNWWNDTNEVFVAGNKQTNSIYRVQNVVVSDRPVSANNATAVERRLDCLAAGTLVWTWQGKQAIETIQIGDMVLSQDPETGELTYKAVVRTTVRPAGETVKIHYGQHHLETSGGHLFWVSGDGWIKSRQLKSGMQLHTINGVVPVQFLEPGRKIKTYNLIVDGHHTYFVGAGRVLSHDNSVRQSTNAVVPGLRVE
ncbi:MAG TPA: hypothetical protein EYN70_12900, partial [Planctomycetaceae bacterium]|nr:hypothetical protein [Planctomycetaceae bacterium]